MAVKEISLWVCCLSACCVGLGCLRCIADDGASQTILVKDEEPSLLELLESVSATERACIVMEMPKEDLRIKVGKGPKQTQDLFKEIENQFGRKMVERKGIVVFGPGVVVATEAGEAKYLKAIEGGAEMLETLPKGLRDAVDAEEWLDVKALPAGQTERVRQALFEKSPGDLTWDYWLNQRRAAVGFVFDPYVELEGFPKPELSRLFFRLPYRVPAYDRLVPGSVRGALRPGSPARKP